MSYAPPPSGFHELQVTRQIPVSLLKDIMTTAVEGGSVYWLNGEVDQMIESVERDDHGVTAIKGIKIDVGSLNGPFNGDADLQTILDGLALLVSKQPLKHFSDSVRNRIVGAIFGDPEDFFNGEDAGTADIILQLGLFGEVVFG